MSPAACSYRLKRLERRYSISYNIEFGPRPFGFFRYIVLVKFKWGKPDISVLKKVLEREPLIQLALVLKGSYDLIFYVLAENTQLLDDAIYRIRSDPSIARFKSYWTVTYISRAYGYTPLREEFIETLKEKVWHKSKEHPRKAYGELLEREYLILKELNQNGRISFTNLDKKLGLNSGASDYTYNRLVEKGVIGRITINMQKPPMKYPAVLITKQFDINAFNSHRMEFMTKLISLPKTPTNRYAIVGDIGAPYGLIFIMPIYDSIDLAVKEVIDISKQEQKDIKEMIVTDVLFGSIGFRRIAPEETYQYKYLKKISEIKGKDNIKQQPQF